MWDWMKWNSSLDLKSSSSTNAPTAINTAAHTPAVCLLDPRGVLRFPTSCDSWAPRCPELGPGEQEVWGHLFYSPLPRQESQQGNGPLNGRKSRERPTQRTEEFRFNVVTFNWFPTREVCTCQGWRSDPEQQSRKKEDVPHLLSRLGACCLWKVLTWWV